MAFFDRMERRFGWLTFPGFLRYYALMHVLVYVLQIVSPNIGAILEFDRHKILAGEVWRLVTFLFASSGMGGTGFLGIIFLLFMVMIAFLMSDALEEAWGTFKATLFYLFGILCLIVANFVMPVIVPGSGFLIYGSAFFAFATLYPKVELMLGFFLPVQARFFGWLQALFLVVAIFGNVLLLPYFLVGYLNYLLWAAIPALRGKSTVIKAAYRRREFESAKVPEHEAFHRCAVCGRTDRSNPELEFRIGHEGEEYCGEHLPK